MSLDAEIRNRGEAIFKQMDAQTQSLFNKDFWYGRIMEESMKNTAFKTQMFRFVDVLPYLKSGSEVARHLKEYFAEGGDELPGVFKFGVGLGSFAPGIMAGVIRKQVTEMAKMFIAGQTAEEALPLLKKGRQNHLGFTADLLGESALSEKEALEYQQRYLDLMQGLSKDAQTWASSETLDRDHLGAIPKVNVSVKVSSLYSQVNVKDWAGTKEVLKERLRPLLSLAKDRQIFLNLDMEQYALKDLTLEIFQELLMEPSYATYPHFGIVIQAYLKDAFKDCGKMVEFARTRKVPFTIRLVKGAYWDYETIQAQARGWPCPVFTNKADSDLSFEECATLLLKNLDLLKAAFGSHNVRSIAFATVTAEKLGLAKNSFEIQMLYGMAEPIKKSLVQMGYRVREYVPIGELIPGMAYLVRRLLENTSNESFLKSKFADNTDSSLLLKDPREKASLEAKTQFGANPNTSSAPSLARATEKEHFENEPLLDFGIAEVRSRMSLAIEKLSKRPPITIPAVIGKKEIALSRTFPSINPSHPTQVLAHVGVATAVDADHAVQTAKATLASWSKTPFEERARYLDLLAAEFRSNKYELAAQQVLEVGKTWSEADGDVAEAIDFCVYYAKEIRRLGRPQKVGHAPGEVSHYHYQPRGVSVVIAPWNFPLAILTGMVGASFVTGNTVIMKPAEQSSIIAWQLMEAIRKIGLPPGVVNFLPGFGEEVGAALVNHHQTDLIAFTGSRAVGLSILQAAAQVRPGQKSMKRAIIEMGGKNAVIVDSDADLDEAVAGILYSAFGFSGQKCSAASRVIVLDEIYDRFLERFHEAAKSICVDFSEKGRTYMGPVIDKEAQERILSTIERAQAESQILFQGEVPREGFFVPPTIFVDVDPKSSLAQEEIFGPVVAIMRCSDMDQALEIANGTAYALTGGLFSRSPGTIDRVRKEFEVGNLYINRQITGAMVDRHPFGGFKMSGVGSKTGGPDYLLQFVEPRCVTENTMRRGFAPEE